VIEIGLLALAPPAFNSGNALGSLRMKSGFDVTTSVNEVVNADGAPAVVAWMVTE
jgi:hypothetical protein